MYLIKQVKQLLLYSYNQSFDEHIRKVNTRIEPNLPDKLQIKPSFEKHLNHSKFSPFSII